MFKNCIQIICIILLIRLKFALKFDPCQNFHSYACSNNSLDILQQLNFKFNEQLYNLLNAETLMDHIIAKYMASLTNSANKQTFYDKIVIYFESCLGENKSRSIYLNAIKPFANVKEKLDYWSLLGRIQSYGLENIIVKHHIRIYKNNTVNIILGPVRTEDFKEHLPELYIEEFLKDQNFKHQKCTKEKLKDMELKLKNLSKIQNLNPFLKNTRIKINFMDLNVKYPRLKLQEFFKILLNNNINNNNTIIYLENPPYFKYLNALQWSDEELKHLHLYLIMKFVYYLEQNQTHDFDGEACLQDVKNKFDLGVNLIYYYRYFRLLENEYFKAIKDLEIKLKAIMLKLFEANYLDLSSKQKKYLTQKLYGIKIKFGHLIPVDDLTIIQEFYDDLSDFDRGNYYQNYLNLLKHHFYRDLLEEPIQQYFINKNSCTTPFYESDLNTIVIPFASLQLPLYHYRQTPLHQLSQLGFVLAHELTHAFDSNVLPSDNNELAWSITNHTNFNNSLKCMLQQHETSYINEHVADFVGIRVAFKTYKTFYAKNNDNNWKKEFFMNFAKLFCNKNVRYTEHDEDPVRLQQILRNFAPFGEVFQCKMGDFMHPKDKCRIY